MYLLDESLFLPLVGCEFEDVKLESFSPTSLYKHYGKPSSLKNIESEVYNKDEKYILQEITTGKRRFQYLISDALSYNRKFMIFDTSRIEDSLKYYIEHRKIALYSSTVFFDGTDLIFIDTTLEHAFAIDHEYNYMVFNR